LESSSQQTEHVQNPATNPDITLQMIEPVDSTQFIGQKRAIQILNTQVTLYLSVCLFLQHFDGIDCLEAKFANMLIHHVTHPSSLTNPSVAYNSLQSKYL
jgi:hypothetical protein